MGISQTTLVIVSLAILIYIAFVITSIYTIGENPNEFKNSLKLNSDLYNQISTGSNYIYKADSDKSVYTVLLNGLNFSSNQLMLLFDSTPYASKGHIAMLIPCNEKTPNRALFDVLVGQAPSVVVLPLGYIENMSSVKTGCVFHGQFGFGDPVTDIALKYVGENSTKINGPYSVIVSTHESYIPTASSFMEMQHTHSIK